MSSLLLLTYLFTGALGAGSCPRASWVPRGSPWPRKRSRAERTGWGTQPCCFRTPHPRGFPGCLQPPANPLLPHTQAPSYAPSGAQRRRQAVRGRPSRHSGQAGVHSLQGQNSAPSGVGGPACGEAGRRDLSGERWGRCAVMPQGAWVAHSRSVKEPDLTGRHRYSLQSLVLLTTSRRNLGRVLFSVLLSDTRSSPFCRAESRAVQLGLKLLFSHSVVSDSLRRHGLWHARLP